MLILPAIDLLDGECVRLVQGDYGAKTTYAKDPVAVAKSFEDQGASWIHIVDLNGARDGHTDYLHLIESIARSGALKIEFGGGIRTRAAAQMALDSGATRVVIGSKIIEDPEAAAAIFQDLGERAVAGLDAKNGKVATGGWLDLSDSPVEQVAQWVEEQGGSRIILTDISKDGMLQGPNLELLRSVLEVTNVPVIQSGGVTTLEEIRSILETPGRKAEGVIIGKAIYEKRINLAEAVQQFQFVA